MTTVFRWKNISTVFIRHFALALSRAESTSALLSASRNHLPRVTRRCPDGIPRCGNRRRQRRNFSEDSRDRVTFDPLSPRHSDNFDQISRDFTYSLPAFLFSNFWVYELYPGWFVCCGVFDRIVGLLIHMLTLTSRRATIPARPSWTPLADAPKFWRAGPCLQRLL